MIKYIIFFLLLLFIPSVAVSGEDQEQSTQMSIEQIQKIDSINNAKEALDKLAQLADSMTKQKYSDCLKAFGDEDFCHCISENLPVPVSFERYVQIVTTSKEDLGYSFLDQENKEIVDAVINTREYCVSR